MHLQHSVQWGGGRTGGRETGRKGGGRCTKGGRRGGRKRDSQGGGKREKKGKITQHCAIFRNRKNAKGRGPKNTGREAGGLNTPVPPPPPPLYSYYSYQQFWKARDIWSFCLGSRRFFSSSWAFRADLLN